MHRPQRLHLKSCTPRRSRQRGVFVMATAVALLVLLGFVGLALDASRLQLVRAELQNAADACALAAVLELVGDTVRLGTSQSSGYFTWANVLGTDTSGGLEPYVNAFMGFGVCDVPTAPNRCIGIKTGVVTSLDDAWNARFGLYKQGGSGLNPATAIPDLTGYGYRPAPAGGAYVDYMQNRAPSRQAFQGHLSSYTSPLGVHAQYGASSRRLVSMPVVACTSTSCGTGSKPILGWACALLLSPKSPSQDAEVEFRGRADVPGSGCTTSGVPGGVDSGGPLVPVLVH